MAYSYSLTVESETAVTGSGTESEKFRHALKLAAGATDVSLTLGTITDPVYIAVLAAEGVSFKLASGGTDAIGANPCAFVADETGLGVSEILLSNSSGAEVDVTVLAAE